MATGLRLRNLVHDGNEDRIMNNSATLSEPRAGNKPGVAMSILQVTVRIAIIISLAELFIMQAFAAVLHDLGTNAEALLDAALLVVLSTPFIYGWVIKSFVQERNEAINSISRLAYRDSLTDLSNRRFLTEYLEKGLAGCVRHQTYGGLLLIDLDDFKKINDSYGHEAGDAVLVEVAKRLQTTTRTEDLVSRLGGDEFIITLLQLGETAEMAHEKAMAVARKLQRALKEPIPYKGSTLQINSSIGVRLLETREEGVHAVMREADYAMYRAKRSGKGSVIFFEEATVADRV